MLSDSLEVHKSQVGGQKNSQVCSLQELEMSLLCCVLQAPLNSFPVEQFLAGSLGPSPLPCLLLDDFGAPFGGCHPRLGCEVYVRISAGGWST